MAGHQGFQRTFEKLAKNYYWKSMREDTMKYVQSCDTCQRIKTPTTSPAGLLKPMPIPDERFKTISVDFMELPKNQKGKDFAMIIVDKLSKLVKIIPMKKTDGSKECAELILKEWICTGKGIYSTIISDRDTRFTSKLWEEVVGAMKAQSSMATARHQQTNGQAEHAVKMVKTCLRAYIDYQGRNWEELIPFVEYCLNNSVSSSTGYTPFQLAYGTSPDKVLPTINQDLQTDIQEQVDLARLRLARQQDAMEAKANESRTPVQPVLPGERVLLKREGINWPAESQDDNKLLTRYLGPFKVKSIDDHGNFELELPSVLRIHNKFAPDVIKRYYEPDRYFPTRSTPPPIRESYNPEVEYHVEKYLDHRVWYGQKQFLIRWKGFGKEFDTWERADAGTDEEDQLAEYQRSRGGVIEWKTAATPSPRAKGSKGSLKGRKKTVSF